jgi:hypothetical protein
MPSTSPAAGPVGYAWIRDHLGLPSFLGPREARIANVNSIERSPEGSLRILAKVALEQDLLRETRFLADFDRVYRKIDERFDVRSTDLSNLIVFALQQEGRLSMNRRKQYGERVQAEALDTIEVEVQACLAERAQSESLEDRVERDSIPRG